MKRLLTWLSRMRFPYNPLITVELSKSRLIHNLEQFRTLAPHGNVAPVLKSNAYGHGLLEIAWLLEGKDSIPFFIVDSYFEAVALLSAGIRTPLLVIGYSRPETVLKSRKKNVIFTLTNFEMLEAVKKTHHPIRFHLKIDTGMHRQGVRIEDVDAAIGTIHKNKHLILEGICSHLPDADNADPTFTNNQISLWNSLVAKFKKEFPTLKHIHLSATDGHRFSKQIDATLSRVGIGLYGIGDTEGVAANLNLLPVLEMKAIVSGVKKLHGGETVGYHNTFKADHEMNIATVPVGYFEGLDTRLSNAGVVLVGPKRVACPIIGRVSMNITTCDVSAIPDLQAGVEGIAISRHRQDRNSIASIASICGNPTHEVLVKIPPHLKRVIVE